MANDPGWGNRNNNGGPPDLDEVLRQSDYVSMHAPDTASAKKMLTEKHFKMMKPTAMAATSVSRR